MSTGTAYYLSRRTQGPYTSRVPTCNRPSSAFAAIFLLYSGSAVSSDLRLPTRSTKVVSFFSDDEVLIAGLRASDISGPVAGAATGKRVGAVSGAGRFVGAGETTLELSG